MHPQQAPPLPHQTGRSSKPVPKWVWWLAGASVLFLIGTYALLYFGWTWAMGLQREEFRKANPDFEFLYVTTKGKVRARHLPTGREYVFNDAPGRHTVQVAMLESQPVEGPLPEWLRLPAAKQEDSHTLLVDSAETFDVLAQLEEAAADHGYRRELPGGENVSRDLVTCNPKTLECIAFSIRAADKGTRYQLWRSRVSQ